jgi:hypothetical protein
VELLKIALTLIGVVILGAMVAAAIIVIIIFGGALVMAVVLWLRERNHAEP